jgi:hypothetical protein
MRINREDAIYPIVPQQNFAKQRFSNGVSRHGKIYSLDPTAKIINTHAAQIEIIFELYRRAHHPNKPSRYLSMFGCESAREVAYFRGQTQCGIDVNIYEIHSDENFHRGDMNLLNSNCSAIEIEYRSELYWSGETEVIFEGYKPFWEIIIPLPATVGDKINE